MRTDRRSDAELVEACNQAGPDEAASAFEQLYRRHRDYVLRVAMRFSHDREITLDVLQETFIYLLKKFPPTGEGLSLTARLTTLLYPVAKSLAITAVRKGRRFEASDAPAPHELPDPNEPRNEDDDLAIALSGLTEERREVLMLRFVDGMSLSEIAEVLGIPPGTVKSRLHIAIKQLRDDPKINDLFPS